MQAYSDSGQMVEDERGWTTFASNVGKARILRHDEMELRLRWLGAVLLVIVVAVAGWITVRFVGMRAGWWPSLLPAHFVPGPVHDAWSAVQGMVTQVVNWFNS